MERIESLFLFALSASIQRERCSVTCRGKLSFGKCSQFELGFQKASIQPRMLLGTIIFATTELGHIDGADDHLSLKLNSSSSTQLEFCTTFSLYKVFFPNGIHLASGVSEQFQVYVNTINASIS